MAVSEMNRLGTKIDTLQLLSKNIQTGKILPLYGLNIGAYRKNKENCIQEIQAYFTEELLIVRSTCEAEDQTEASNAGKFSSILNVPKNNKEEMVAAIDQVISSYVSHDMNKEKVLIQPMLKNIVKSGVIFTCDIDTLAPYYTINYDESEQSDTITSGTKNELQTYIYYKESPFPPKENDLKKIIYCCEEIESFFETNRLDIEFAIDTNGDVYIFQVRPIVIRKKVDLSTVDVKDSLLKVYNKIQKLFCEHPNLLGNQTVFGVMPDWNPAEIIGIRPKKLAISLYKELITDYIWAHQRNNYGYRDLRAHPLLVSFLGIPFIDVRVSLNSFIPKSLNDTIAEKLVDFYINGAV